MQQAHPASEGSMTGSCPWSVLFLALFGLAVVGCSGTEGRPGGIEGHFESLSDLTVHELPENHGAASWLSKFATAFGVPVYASAEVPDAKVLHAATVIAEYLDNDEDGVVDDPAVVKSLVENNAALVMFETAEALETSGILESSWADQIWGQDLAADETAIPGRFDATLEEVLHLINTAGHAQVYPDFLGMERRSALTEAMDVARGGRFLSVPSNYPGEAWYHYSDSTCDYSCMATEYLYWGLTSLLGAQADRCDEISVEWKLCTPTQVQQTDSALHTLLTDPELHMPSVLPDGRITPP